MDKIIERKIYTTLLASLSLSALLFLASLTQNAYYIKEGEESTGALGLILLLTGFFGMKGAGISWLANPCLFISLLHLKRGYLKKAKIFSIISVLFGLSFLLFDQVVANEGGGKTEIISYGCGYWLWLSSLIINLLGIIAANISTKSSLK